METFANWLLNELDERGWSQAELARRCGVTKPTISRIINGERRIGNDVAIAIAQVFHMPPEDVFRKAGLLPPKPEIDQELEEINHLIATLPPELREETIEYVRYLIDKQERKARGKIDLQNSMGTTNAV